MFVRPPAPSCPAGPTHGAGHARGLCPSRRPVTPARLLSNDGPQPTSRKLRRATCARSTTRRDFLLAAAAAAPCTCAVCLAQTQAGKDAYKRFFAQALATTMDEYEERVGPRKAALLGSNLAALTAAAGRSPSRRLAVLDLGVGAAPNAPYLVAVPGMGRVTGVDPNPFMFPYARARAADAGFLVACGEGTEDGGDDASASPSHRPTFTTVRAAAEGLPFPDASFDAVVCTLVLCSVTSVQDTLAEAARVLRPGGRFLFSEHTAAGWSEAPLIRAAQALFDPLQQALADGCHLTRDPEAGLAAAPGLRLVEVERFTVPGMAFIGPHVAGVAVKKE